MTRDEIDDVVCEILEQEGEGHNDGHGRITEFILAVMEGRGGAWAKTYQQKLDCDTALGVTDREFKKQGHD